MILPSLVATFALAASMWLVFSRHRLRKFGLLEPVPGAALKVAVAYVAVALRPVAAKRGLVPASTFGALGLGLSAFLAGVAVLGTVETHSKVAPVRRLRGRRATIVAATTVGLEGARSRDTRCQLGANLRHIVSIMSTEGCMRRPTHKLPDCVVCCR